MKANSFRERVGLMTSWFKEWNECEQTVALYSLLKKSSPVQAIFLDQVLQQSLAECMDVRQLEAQANDEAYIKSLQSEGSKEEVTHQLLRLLPLLQVGKTSVKKAYLQLIPELLSHTICNGVNVEESRQLLSYSLIHPAITLEERTNFQMWMGSLEDRFTYSGSGTTSTAATQHSTIYQHGQHMAGGLSCGSSSGCSTAASSGVEGSSSNSSITNNKNNLNVAGHCHSPSLCSPSQHSLVLTSSPDISASQESINIVTNNLSIPPPPPPPPPPLPANVPQQQQQHLSHPHQHGLRTSPSPAPGAHLGSWNSLNMHQHPSHQQSGLVVPGGYRGDCEAGAAINPAGGSGDASPSGSSGHPVLRATNSHAGAFGAASSSHGNGHMLLHATSSAPPKFSSSLPPPPSPILPSGPSQQSHPSQQQQHNSHAPLRRTQSIAPPIRLQIQNTDKSKVTDWLKTNHGHQHLHQSASCPPHDAHSYHSSLQQMDSSSSSKHHQPLQLRLQRHPHPILPSRAPQFCEHAPLSPQSSVTSSGSGGSDQQSLQHLLDDGPQPTRDSFLEPGSGMREVPVWLKSLRLHKYAYLFKQLSYEEMLDITEEMLEQQNVTKGARHRIHTVIVKLRERQEVLRQLEKSIVEEGGPIKPALGEMKQMLNTPIKPSPSRHSGSSAAACCTTSSPQLSSSSSVDDVMEGDLPAQFCRLMGKICTQLLTASSRDDACFQLYLQLIDKCLNHEAFSNQRRLLQSWKQSAQKIWQPPPQKYSDKPRRFGQTFPAGASLGSRILPRASRGPVPVTYGHQLAPGSQHWGFGTKRSNHGSGHQMVPGMQHWGFGTKRSILGSGSGAGHMPVQRNSSLNAPFVNKPGLLEQGKQPVSRTHSAPIHRPLTLPLQGCDTNDTEINARLDSLCISMTEHALGSSDNNDRGSNF